MKKFVIVMLVLLVFSSGFSTAKIGLGTLSVSDSSIDSGETGILSFSITNTGDRNVNDVKVTISTSLGMSSYYENLGVLRETESKQVIVNYDAEDLPPGDYSVLVNVDYTADGQEYFVQDSTTVTVNAYKYLVLEEYTSSLVINQDNGFGFNVSNQGDDVMRNILLDVVMPSGFVPRAGSQFFIQKLGVGESKAYNFTVFIEKSVDPGNFQFTLNKTANSYSDMDTMNVAVRGSPDIAVSGINLDPEVPLEEGDQTISVQLENIGTGKAYSIAATLVTDNENVTGVKSEFLGTLDRDDLSTAIFDVHLPKNLDSLDGEIIVTYEGELGEGHNLTQEFSYYVRPLVVDNTVTYYVIGVVFLIAGWFLWKRFRK